MSDDLSEEPVTYAIRITERAQRDIDLATLRVQIGLKAILFS